MGSTLLQLFVGFSLCTYSSKEESPWKKWGLEEITGWPFLHPRRSKTIMMIMTETRIVTILDWHFMLILLLTDCSFGTKLFTFWEIPSVVFFQWFFHTLKIGVFCLNIPHLSYFTIWYDMNQIYSIWSFSINLNNWWTILSCCITWGANGQKQWFSGKLVSSTDSGITYLIYHF